MGHPPKRNKYRARTPQFGFNVRKIMGVPERDDSATRAEKDRAIAEFLEKRRKEKING